MTSICERKFGDWAFGQKDEQCLTFVRFIKDNKVNFARVHHTKLSECLSLECLADWDDPIEKITVYREGKITSRQFHAFVLMVTKKYYYSIERWATYVSLQCSTSMDDVIYFDKARKRSPIRETEWATGRGTVADVVRLLLEKKLFEKKYQIYFRNCQLFAALVFKNFNSDGLKLKKYRKRGSAGIVSLTALKRIANTIQDIRKTTSVKVDSFGLGFHLLV